MKLSSVVSFDWDFSQIPALTFFHNVDSAADAILSLSSENVVFLTPGAPIPGDAWESLCLHKKILAVRSRTMVSAITNGLYFKLPQSQTKVSLLRVYPHSDIEKTTFGRRNIYALIGDASELRQCLNPKPPIKSFVEDFDRALANWKQSQIKWTHYWPDGKQLR